MTKKRQDEEDRRSKTHGAGNMLPDIPSQQNQQTSKNDKRKNLRLDDSQGDNYDEAPVKAVNSSHAAANEEDRKSVASKGSAVNQSQATPIVPVSH